MGIGLGLHSSTALCARSSEAISLWTIPWSKKHRRGCWGRPHGSGRANSRKSSLGVPWCCSSGPMATSGFPGPCESGTKAGHRSTLWPWHCAAMPGIGARASRSSCSSTPGIPPSRCSSVCETTAGISSASSRRIGPLKGPLDTPTASSRIGRPSELCPGGSKCLW